MSSTIPVILGLAPRTQQADRLELLGSRVCASLRPRMTQMGEVDR